MWRKYRRHYIASLVCCTVVLAITSVSFIGCRRQQSPSQVSIPPEQLLSQQEKEALAFRVDPGDPGKAVTYYTETLEELGLRNWESLPAEPEKALEQLATLQSIAQPLEFLGYKDLFPAEFEKNIENLSSGELMAKYPDEILASAFFAPKITDVSGSDASKINVGWRKVVYLKARSGSPAEARGIGAGLLLFNKFQGAGNWKEDPFTARKDKSNESKTTQFMLIRRNEKPPAKPLTYPTYFLVYARLSEGGKLKAALDATFDARADEFKPVRPYYVPDSCAQCHGAETTPFKYDLNKVKLNFLDTDHWFDRVQGKDDFAFLQQYDYGVLYDGGKVFDVKDGDTVSQQFKDAFNVLRKINEKIKEQNEKVDADTTPSSPSFQLRGVRKWLELHVKADDLTDVSHKGVFQRAFDGGDKWAEGRDPDRELLPLMNQYCYRCHSSVRFSIFDRPLVQGKRTIIKIRLDATDPAKWMPQDRQLSDDLKKQLKTLVDGLKP